MTKQYPITPPHNHDEVYAKIGEGGGVTDHGLLTGLEDNDHPQYLLTTGKAADADKLDGIDSTGFVQTSGNQTVAGIKTFSSIPVLPATNPTTANQAVRKGYADATYSATGHTHTGVYIPLNNYSGYTGTIVGWAAGYVSQLTYVVIGKLLLMSVYISGTSNATATTITIPSGLTSASQGITQIQPVRVTDNGAVLANPGMAILANNGTVITFYSTYGGAGFTASGTKQVSGNFAWIIA